MTNPDKPQDDSGRRHCSLKRAPNQTIFSVNVSTPKTALQLVSEPLFDVWYELDLLICVLHLLSSLSPFAGTFLKNQLLHFAHADEIIYDQPHHGS